MKWFYPLKTCLMIGFYFCSVFSQFPLVAQALLIDEPVVKTAEKRTPALRKFVGSLSIFCKDQKCGLMNTRTNKIVLKPKYEWISDYYEQEGSYDYVTVDCKNKDIPYAWFTVGVNHYKGGIALVNGQLWSNVDGGPSRAEEMLVAQQVSLALHSEKKEPCSSIKQLAYIPAIKGGAIVSKNGRFGFVNRRGFLEIFPNYPNLKDLLAELIGYPKGYYKYHSMIKVSNQLFAYQDSTQKYGFIKANGKVLSAPIYDHISQYQGFIKTMQRLPGGGMKYGCLHQDGLFTVPPKYQHIEKMEGKNVLLVTEMRDGTLKYGLIDYSTTQFIVEPMFDDWGKHIVLKGKEYDDYELMYTINKYKKEIFLPYLLLKDGDTTTTIVNFRGRPLLSNYRIITHKGNGLVEFAKADKRGIYDFEQKRMCLLPKYEAVEVLEGEAHPYFLVQKSGKWELLNYEGERIQRKKFHSFEKQANDKVLLTKKRKKYIFDAETGNLTAFKERSFMMQ